MKIQIPYTDVGIDASHARLVARVRAHEDINAPTGQCSGSSHLFIRQASRGLITAAHYANCQNFLGRASHPRALVCRLATSSRKPGEKIYGILA